MRVRNKTRRATFDVLEPRVMLNADNGFSGVSVSFNSINLSSSILPTSITAQEAVSQTPSLAENEFYKEPVVIENPSPDLNDAFGTLAVDNGITVVGVPDDDTKGDNAGIAYLYLDGNSPPIALQSPDAGAGERFGQNVAISGTTVAIAEPGDVHSDLDPAPGSVHLYDIPTATWKKITQPAAHSAASFGEGGLKLTSEVLLVSSNSRSTGTPIASKVYAINPTSSALQQTFELPGVQRPVVSELDVDGDWVVIGSSDYEDVYTTTDVGQAYLWNWRTGTSITIENPTPAQDDFFGESVAIEGNTVVISAPGDDGAGTDQGRAYIYKFNTTTGAIVSYTTVDGPATLENAITLPSVPNTDIGFAQSVEIHGGLIWLGSTSLNVNYSTTVNSHVTILDYQGNTISEIELPKETINSLPVNYGIVDDLNGDLIDLNSSYLFPGTLSYFPYHSSEAPQQFGIDLAFDESNDHLVVGHQSASVSGNRAAGSIRTYELIHDNTLIVNSTTDGVDATELGDGKANTESGLVTLRAAIQEANALDEQTLIVLPPGEYQLSLTGSGTAAGDLDISGDIIIRGSGAGQTIINASGMSGERIFDITGELDISGVTLTGADLTAGQNGMGGGAIWVRSAGTLELNDSVLTGNTAGGVGGAIYNAGSLTVNQSVITQNHSGKHGGGVRNVGTAAVNRSVIARNSGGISGADLRGQFVGDGFNMRTSGSGTTGLQSAVNGAVDLIVTEFADHADSTFDTADLSLREAIISANAAGGPVTIWIPAGHHHLDLAGSGDRAGDLDITGEVTIVGPGAGVAIIDATNLTNERIFDVSGTLNLQGVTLTGADITEGNNGNSGGAIWVRNAGTASVHESAITGNRAGNVGGGIYSAGTTSVTDSVITNNHAANRAGGIRAVGTVTLRNSIVAQNTLSVSYSTYNSRDALGRFDTDGTNRLTWQPDSYTFRNDSVRRYVDRIVTSVEDRFDHTDDAFALTIREAVDSASTYDEIWLPAWHFNLTLDGDGGIEEGAINVKYNQQIYGISESETVIDATDIHDQVFDRLGVSRFYEYDLETIDG